MLTKRQKQILDYVTAYAERNGYAPTLEEVKGYFGLKSVATVHEHLELLKSKGYIEKEKNKTRAFRPVEIPLSVAPAAEMLSLNLLGRIAAGAPIEAVEDPEAVILPVGMLKTTEGHYALRVVGDSMIESGVLDGDIILIKQCATVDNGTIAVCILEDGGATLKRVYREKRGFRLEPANAAYAPIYTDYLEVRGQLMGVIRTYR